jgi:hypothetical protein
MPLNVFQYINRGSNLSVEKGGAASGRLSNVLEAAGWAVIAVSGVVASTSTIQQVHQGVVMMGQNIPRH